MTKLVIFNLKLIASNQVRDKPSLMQILQMRLIFPPEIRLLQYQRLTLWPPKNMLPPSTITNHR